MSKIDRKALRQKIENEGKQASKRLKDWSEKLLKQQVPIIEIPNEETENSMRSSKKKKQKLCPRSTQSSPNRNPKVFEFSRKSNSIKNQNPLQFSCSRHNRPTKNQSQFKPNFLPIQSTLSMLTSPKQLKHTFPIRRTLFQQSSQHPKLTQDLHRMSDTTVIKDRSIEKYSLNNSRQKVSHCAIPHQLASQISNLKRLLNL